MNRPDKLNAISPRLRSDMLAALAEFSTGDLIRVVRIKGAGRCFSTGYDLEDGYLASAIPEAMLDPRPEFRESAISADITGLRRQIDWVQALRRFRKPLVVQAHGLLLSGGLDICAAADLVFATTDAKVGHPGARGFGLPVTLGLLPMRIGMLRTKHLLFTGDTIDGNTAEKWGLINEAVDPEQIDDYVAKYCARIALQPLDILLVHKAATNRWFEIMGLNAAVEATMDINAHAHQTAWLTKFMEISDAQGLKSALNWRDDPFDRAAAQE
jgi:enoyl-CoA hydratase